MDLSTSGLTSVAAACVASVTAVIGWSLYQKNKNGRTLPLPPGPTRLPYIGNMHQLVASGANLWEMAKDMRKTYGDLVFMEVASFPMLFLNTQEAAVEALTKKSSVNSSRPQYTMSSLGGWGWTTPMLPYGERLRKQRHLLHKFFSSPTILNYAADQERLRYVFLKSMLETPEKYDWHVRRLPGITLMLNAYGHDALEEDDRYVEMGEKSFKVINGLMNYIFLDMIPWLKYLPKWFPGTGFHKVAEDSRRLSDNYKREIYDLTLKKTREGTARECMTTILNSGAYKDKDVELDSAADDEDFMDVAGIVFLAGGDTTSSVMMGLMVALLKFPEVQRRGQAEVDAVVGKDRMPTFEDRERLPYVNAMCIELLRWEIVVPMAIPHRSTADDVFRGYHVPEGTIMVPNLWAITTDETLYPKPHDFMPERWLPGGPNVDSLRPQEYIFGYGRRTCPGRAWAEHMLFIFTASVLASFNLERAVDKKGVPIPLAEKREVGTLRYLAGPSPCKVTPRSEKMAQLIRDFQVYH